MLLRWFPQFPSSEVVISTSSDLTARIFSALDGSNPRTLKGHTAAVTDSAIIERGRHVLTTSNDGTLKLWLVGESKCVKTWRFGHGSRKRALRVVTFPKKSGPTTAEGSLDPEVAGKAAAVTLEDGTLAVIDLDSSGGDPPVQTIKATRNGKALTALAVTELGSITMLAVGSADGIITLVSINASNLSEPAKVLLHAKRNSADVTDLKFITHSDTPSSDTEARLLSSSMDGLLYESRISILENEVSVKVEAEFAGYDIDACNVVVQRGNDIYSAGKDGHLRRY